MRDDQTRLDGQDFETIDHRKAEKDCAGSLTFYTDLPVHKSVLEDQGLPFMSPWVILGPYLDDGDPLRLQKLKSGLQTAYHKIYPIVRRGASFYSNRDWKKLAQHLSSEDPPQPPVDDVHSSIHYHYLLKLLLQTVLYQDSHLAWQDPFKDHYLQAKQQHPSVYQTWVEKFIEDHGFLDIHRKLVDLIVRVYAIHDALLPGLIFENFAQDARDSQEEFRSFRDDFDALRQIYKDLFELAYTTIPYIGVIINISKRGNPLTWANGKTSSLEARLDDNPHNLEFIHEEISGIDTLYNRISRNTRNEFGHYDIHHDFSSGELVDTQENRENFLDFLSDYLDAIRVCALIEFFDFVIISEYEDINQNTI